MTHWLGLIIAQAIAGTAPAPDDRALHLDIAEDDDRVTVQVIGNSPRAQHVSFTIELTGASHSKHSASLTLAANDRQTLSTLKIRSSDNWCAKLVVEEEGQAPYELTEGHCPR